MGRLQSGVDLLNGLTDKVCEVGVRAGYVFALGTLRNAVIGFYDQDRKEYDSLFFDEPLEIVTCQGNISIKDEQVMLHLHISIGDEKGEMYGGHLMEGSEVAVVEFCIAEFSGDPLERNYDEEFKLDLWLPIG